MKLSTLLTVFLILAVAGFCFSQERQAPKPKPMVKATAHANLTIAKFPNLKPVPVEFKDGLQCLLGKASEINAAYTEAAASGCKKMSTGQGTAYNCETNAAYTACSAASEKLQTIFKNCGLKEPGTAEFFGGAIATPGCNSLGIGCLGPIY